MGGVARSRGKGAELIVSGQRDTSITAELAPLRPLHGEAERGSEPIAAAWGTALSMEVSPRFRLCCLRGSRRESFLRCTAGRALSPPRGIFDLQVEARTRRSNQFSAACKAHSTIRKGEASWDFWKKPKRSPELWLP